MQIPASIVTAAANLEDTASQVAAHQSAAAGRLQSVLGDYEPGALTAAASVASGTRSTIRAILAGSGQIITVTPWTQGAGETGDGFYSQQLKGYLSPGKAMEYLFKKLRDAADPGKDDAAEMMLIIVSSNSLSAWISRLTALNQVCQIGELPFCERRATALASLWSDKMIRKTAPLNPHFTAYDFKQCDLVKQTASRTEALAALNGAYAADINPIQELINFSAARSEKAAVLLNSWNSLKEAVSGGDVDVRFFSGSAYSIAYQMPVTAGAADNNAEVYSAAVAITGASGSLQFFREVFS